MKTRYKFTFLFLLFVAIIQAQTTHEQLSALNIEHYKLSIELNDENNNIKASMEVSMRFMKNIAIFDLDFVEQDALTGEGMKVDSIYQNNIPVAFKQQNNLY